MARNLILGNNSMLVSLDSCGQVSDLYFPYVGLENHIAHDSVHRIGVYVDDEMSWLSEDEWEISITCAKDALLGQVRAVNNKAGVKVSFGDVVYNEKNIFIRNVEVENLSERDREIKLYFCQEFQLAESDRADTAYFDPYSRGLVHYKGQRVVLINAFTTEGQFHEYTVGEFNTYGKQGSFKDAEDGMLALNNVEHGNTDSVVALSFNIESGKRASGYYWLCVAESFSEAHKLNQYVLEKNPQYMTRTTKDYWRAWVNRYDYNFYDLSEEAAELFKKSLLFMRAAVDDEGSILASADASMLQRGKDTYSYTWMRDGAFISLALDRSGYYYTSKRFFEFSAEVMSEEGYLMHRFAPDRTLGSSWHPRVQNGKPALPIQEDETALALISLLRHYEFSQDLEFIENIYNSFIKKAANFLSVYRDKNTGLPLPSYDLWEERYGVHTYTAASVYGALRAAAQFAGILGKTKSATQYKNIATEVKQALEEHLYDEDLGAFVKMVTLDENGVKEKDKTIDVSSVYGVISFGVLDAEDPRVKNSLKKTEQDLSVKTEVSGLARYENDGYYRIDNSTPGNPWIISTLWMTQCKIDTAKTKSDLEIVKRDLDWCVKYSLSTGVLPEQLHPHTGKPLSATPLTWSHAEFVLTVIKYLDKLEELGICKDCNPVKKGT
ncbi:MAG: glycoside hydrolase family 15 protein [Candidatus Campbellbacteria bacterium]|nr:glycoside hydrolase family 15 protein [Candidatus Campbellbacteria bacterium]